MKPKISAVAFDMDGLMFNTEDLYDEVGQILLQRRGQNFTRELKLEMMGLPGSVAFELMRQRCSLNESVVELQTETDLIFQTLLPEKIEMMPGLETLLAKLESLSIPKCVATSSHRQFAKQALGFFDLEPRFEFVLTSEDVTNGKPHPEVYLNAAERFKVESVNVLVLEDSHIGSTAAAASGAYTIAVPTAHSRELEFDHVHEIANRLDDEMVLSLFG